MRLFQTTQKQPHQKTYQRVRECSLKTNNLARKEFTNKLQQREGLLAQFRYFLFLKPNIIFLVPLIFFLGLFPSAYIIRNFVNTLWIQCLFVIFYAFLYSIITLFLQLLTPRLDMELHERWSGIMKCCKKKEYWNNDLKQMKRDLNRAILSYRWEGKPWDFIINLLWGGIVIGCLPDPDFQKALITLSPLEIFQANLFGFMCLLFLPFIYIYYFVNFDTPIARMEIIIAQIEFEE